MTTDAAYLRSINYNYYNLNNNARQNNKDNQTNP